MIIWALVCIILLAIAIIVQENKIHKLINRFDTFVEKHNNFVDFVRGEIDDIYDQTNERIDEINHEFLSVYTILGTNKEFADDVTDTLELMCDTDEIVLDRINELEEEVSLLNVEVDDIINELFAEAPEEIEEKPAKKSKKK